MIEKIIINIENGLPLTNLCRGSQQMSLEEYKDIKTCFIGKLYDKFTCDYKVQTDYGCICKYEK